MRCAVNIATLEIQMTDNRGETKKKKSRLIYFTIFFRERTDCWFEICKHRVKDDDAGTIHYGILRLRYSIIRVISKRITLRSATAKYRKRK